MGLLAVLVLSGGLAWGAHAAHIQRISHAPHQNYKLKKNLSPYGGKYLAPKKQRRPSGYYRSTLTGQTVYGKPGKH
jgi:hypothetical protein